MAKCVGLLLVVFAVCCAVQAAEPLDDLVLLFRKVKATDFPHSAMKQDNAAKAWDCLPARNVLSGVPRSEAVACLTKGLSVATNGKGTRYAMIQMGFCLTQYGSNAYTTTVTAFLRCAATAYMTKKKKSG